MTTKQFAAIFGFGFALVWVAFGFGDAVLCLLAAGLSYAAASFLQGDLDLAEVQARLSQGADGPGGSSTQPRAQARVR